MQISLKSKAVNVIKISAKKSVNAEICKVKRIIFDGITLSMGRVKRKVTGFATEITRCLILIQYKNKKFTYLLMMI
jgi:hypothetical protein